MKVSKSWLTELVDLKVPMAKVERLLPLRTIALKEVTGQSIELDMKGYNRSDLLSMRGVSLEVTAITDSRITFTDPNPASYPWAGKNYRQLKVTVEDEVLTPVYCLAKIEGLKVGPSPKSWVKKLADSGMRSINNVADITNLVMLEYGQPLHSFDAVTVSNEEIIVRKAKEGEKIKTLDDKDRLLDPNILLVADPEKALGIAGVMGGKNSEVTDSTTTILLEAAIFNQINIRQTANKLDLVSEASKRFYHGLTKTRLLQALDAAVRMYQEIGGRLTKITLLGDLEDQEKKVPLTLNKTNSLIGMGLKPEQIENYLNKLNFKISGRSGQNSSTSWVVTPPFYRLDIKIEEDLIEEVARMYGYENIPAKALRGKCSEKESRTIFELIRNLKAALVDQGLTELQSYSFYSTSVLENFNWPKKDLVKIANPISSETQYMRCLIWPNLVEAVDKNSRVGFDDIAIFEVGKIYQLVDKKPTEEYHLAVGLMNGTDNPLSELWGLLNKALSALNIETEPQQEKGVQKEGFHPTRYLRVKCNRQDVGEMGEVHQRIVNRFGMEKRIAVAEIDLEEIDLGRISR